MVETPPAENKPRKRQLSEEQPSGNGVKKPKVSVCGQEPAAEQPAGSLQGLGVGRPARRGARDTVHQVCTVLDGASLVNLLT